MDCWWIMELLRDVSTKRYKNDEGLKLKIKTSVKKMTEVLTEVLPQKNYNKVLPIIEYLEKNGEISPKEAENITKKSAATVRRYLKILVDTEWVVAEGSTNNSKYRISQIMINK